MSAAANSRQTAPRIGHVLETSLYVGDLDRSREFYRRLFGLEEFFHDHRMAALGVPGAQVLLLFRRGAAAEPAPTPGGTIPAHDGSGHLHLCFAIALAELADWERHLRAQGVTLESRVSWPRGGISLYFRDPDGNSLEIATPGLWPNR